MTKRLEGMVILIVDDDIDVLDGIDLALRSEGAETLRALDGNEAISQWRNHDPDTVVLDMMLPKRSGFLVLEELLTGDDPPVVVMVTANEGRRHMTYAESLGVHAYLNKPVPLETLIVTISDLWKGRRTPTSE